MFKISERTLLVYHHPVQVAVNLICAYLMGTAAELNGYVGNTAAVIDN